MTTLIVFLAILSILIFVHELGHFLVAKKAGIRVEEFGFGLPPRIWGKKIGETVYSINLLPVGGFVKLAGEDVEETEKQKNKKTEKQFWHKPKRVRAAVIIAGVLLNFLLAVVAFSVIYTKMGIPTKTEQVKIVALTPNSPAEKGGLKVGDIVLVAGGEKIKNSRQFIALTKEFAGQEMNLEVIREGKNLVFFLAPRADPPAGEGPLGIAISQIEMRFYSLWQMPVRGVIEGFKEAFAWTGMIIAALGTMLWQLLAGGILPKDVAGPVGILQITGQVTQGGVLAVLQFLGILSVNLAVINILPIPALDGGRLLFIGFEALTGKRVQAKFEKWAHQIGMIFLLFLILLITLNDIRRILETFSLSDFWGKISDQPRELTR